MSSRSQPVRPRTLSLEGLLLQEAEALGSARSRGRYIHKSGDIDTSGQETEIAVRESIKRRLPSAYQVEHGHLVDRNGAVSSQLDLMILDASSSFSLFRAADSTGYYPVESAYAIGEIKATYRKSDRPVEAFMESLDGIRSMERARRVGRGVIVGTGLAGSRLVRQTEDGHNDLLSLMIFVDDGDFDDAEFERLVRQNDPSRLPGVVILLQSGAVGIVERRLDPLQFHLYRKPGPLPSDLVVALLRVGADGGNPKVESLWMLYQLIAEHLAHSALGPARFWDYGTLIRFEASAVLGTDTSADPSTKRVRTSHGSKRQRSS